MLLTSPISAVFNVFKGELCHSRVEMSN